MSPLPWRYSWYNYRPDSREQFSWTCPILAILTRENEGENQAKCPSAHNLVPYARSNDQLHVPTKAVALGEHQLLWRLSHRTITQMAKLISFVSGRKSSGSGTPVLLTIHPYEEKKLNFHVLESYPMNDSEDQYMVEKSLLPVYTEMSRLY
ncbi:hypothetical protein H112_06821 [Trichophyton rubrum D6]|uniref:Uncharacterized protein n=3 Tax=Trichophyton TaxID=5550 RepID=F2SG45_TRIRC|nr:uncharacterized protein TERG_02170 [Trichophyton rubrum CBS 118892]EZF12198.1 hypothetical protein H100_06844 [Trichophyton rubrum MR850]EZF39055.1 hypothetical protein H102_06805 [Trichophyton rubrum CBS 100081]EZF49620.1 hypothetical protein H103_06829 [Trichophyton rubrum CBS 288.86]EZF60332.1 hypothetical protein H104_06783 [Trichophyton rubrum CBS 289.86]EZF70929.1 hypothetical protein H105_06845 [Trichophyton soudanense CBS 452.61]EZF81606.1 hypothetical protein H110_06824 [Trichophy